MVKFAMKITSIRLAVVATMVFCNFETSLAQTETEPDNVAAEQAVDFARDIAPIFETHCASCHAAGIEKGGFSIATNQHLLENEYALPGRPDESYLVELISSRDGQSAEMPQDSPPLSQEEVARVRLWIAQGATWPEDFIVRERSKADSTWWSLQPLQHPEPPPLLSLAPDSAIDRFIGKKLTDADLQFNQPADRHTLIRRATYDLTGLPPSQAEVDALVNDDREDAFERVVDRLLASPRYGERWGRHWLDVVRFGESNGFERNEIINDAWPFRDYVVQSLNADKPFDQFVREHLAGDVIDPGNPDVEIGSAFLVLGPYDDVGNQDAEQAAQIRANTLDEMIRATSEAFLGLTVGCARCHDHKFDPILQSDYYRLYATLAGTRHGRRTLATDDEVAERNKRLQPLQERLGALEAELAKLEEGIMQRALSLLPEYEKQWARPAVSRVLTKEEFPPVSAKYLRLVCEGCDTNPESKTRFKIDEFEVFATTEPQRNVALAANGSVATGASRKIDDFPGAYGPHLAIDGKFGTRFLPASSELQIEFPAPTEINRVQFSSARSESNADHSFFIFVSEYRIEASLDGQIWQTVASGKDRQPVNDAQRKHRLRELTINESEQQQVRELQKQINGIRRDINQIPAPQTIWMGKHVDSDAAGPFHVFIGGSPQRPGETVLPSSVSVLHHVADKYELPADSDEGQRRRRLAEWLTDEANPLPPRVLVNRLWHYHFGTGIVDTPSDFGYMGGRPSHPELLDWLAQQLVHHDWQLKPIHKLIMLSRTYQQSSEFNEAAARVDGDSRLLWRFPPRRMTAEEIRDTMLARAGALEFQMGGPGFRLFLYTQDNVATYFPLDEHGPNTYRRSIYHQQTRATRTDLMTDFDQPDCAFSASRRAETTTPLQALTALNHSFILDMSQVMASRIKMAVGDSEELQVERAFASCLLREPAEHETQMCRELVSEHGLPALCRVLLNTSELIYIE